MSKRYLVTLTQDERAALRQLVRAGRGPARELTHARILLKADSEPHGPGWPDITIARALDVGLSTVARVRKRFAEGGLDSALRHRRPRREYRRKLDGEQEAHLIALACSPPPLGRRLWTLRLLANHMVELRFVDGISYETIRRLLKKNVLKPWLTERWCIPPEANGEFVWRMEDVLEVYTRPYEYERNGTANLFLCCEPLTSWRSVRVTDRRTRVDWAQCINNVFHNPVSRERW